jgi:hypothetical protein
MSTVFILTLFMTVTVLLSTDFYPLTQGLQFLNYATPRGSLKTSMNCPMAALALKLRRCTHELALMGFSKALPSL